MRSPSSTCYHTNGNNETLENQKLNYQHMFHNKYGTVAIATSRKKRSGYQYWLYSINSCHMSQGLYSPCWRVKSINNFYLLVIIRSQKYWFQFNLYSSIGLQNDQFPSPCNALDCKVMQIPKDKNHQTKNHKIHNSIGQLLQYGISHFQNGQIRT